MQYMPCVWVNTDLQPVKKGPIINFFVVKTENGLSLYGYRNYYYNHPDSIHCMLTIRESECIISDVKEWNEEYPTLQLLFLQQESCKILPSYISHMEKYPPYHNV